MWSNESHPPPLFLIEHCETYDQENSVALRNNYMMVSSQRNRLRSNKNYGNLQLLVKNSQYTAWVLPIHEESWHQSKLCPCGPWFHRTQPRSCAMLCYVMLCFKEMGGCAFKIIDAKIYLKTWGGSYPMDKLEVRFGRMDGEEGGLFLTPNKGHRGRADGGQNRYSKTHTEVNCCHPKISAQKGLTQSRVRVMGSNLVKKWPWSLFPL